MLVRISLHRRVCYHSQRPTGKTQFLDYQICVIWCFFLFLLVLFLKVKEKDFPKFVLSSRAAREEVLPSRVIHASSERPAVPTCGTSMMFGFSSLLLSSLAVWTMLHHLTLAPFHHRFDWNPATCVEVFGSLFLTNSLSSDIVHDG